jgi:hypothetical protein
MKYILTGVLLGLFICGCEAAKCNTDSDCPNDNWFCQFKVGDCQGEDEGLCVRKKSEAACVGTGGIDFNVCGCDSQTYLSDCWRKNAGVSKMHEGPCQ